MKGSVGDVACTLAYSARSGASPGSFTPTSLYAVSTGAACVALCLRPWPVGSPRLVARDVCESGPAVRPAFGSAGWWVGCFGISPTTATTHSHTAIGEEGRVERGGRGKRGTQGKAEYRSECCLSRRANGRPRAIEQPKCQKRSALSRAAACALTHTPNARCGPFAVSPCPLLHCPGLYLTLRSTQRDSATVLIPL